MISGHGNIETAVSAIKRGAYDFIEKPFKADRLVLVADRALETSRLKREVQRAQAARAAAERAWSAGRRRSTSCARPIEQGRADQQPHPDRRPVRAPARSSPRAPSTRRRPRRRPVRRHQRAPRSRPSAWRSSCSASRHRTARRPRKVGALEEAHGGTLFIDEIADMPRETQNKILRVLVDQTFQRVGGTHQGRRSTCASSPRPAAISKPRSPTGVSARTSITACRWCRSACRRSPSGARTSPTLVDYFMDADLAGDRPAASARSATTRWRCCSRTTGRATCASCATTSSG